MRRFLSAAVVLALVAGLSTAADAPTTPPKTAPKIVLKSADGKQTVDLAKLFNEGPVLVRLTCACSGCDGELAQFQKLQAAYNSKGLRTVAIFREKPEA